MGNHAYESPMKPESKDWAKDKVKELFGDDLANLQSTAATTAINDIIKQLDAGTTTATKEHATKGAGLVIAVQILLKDYGYYHGKLDGLIGSKMRGALIEFEKNNKLTMDTGKIGPQILRKLVDHTVVKATANAQQPNKPISGPNKLSPKIKKVTVMGKEYEFVDGKVTIDGVVYPDVSGKKKIPDGLGFWYDRKNQNEVKYGTFNKGELYGKGKYHQADIGIFEGEFRNGSLIEGKYYNPITKSLVFKGTRKDESLLLAVGGKNISIYIQELFKIDSKQLFTKYLNYKTNPWNGKGSKVDPLDNTKEEGEFRNGYLVRGSKTYTDIDGDISKIEGEFDGYGQLEGKGIYTNIHKLRIIGTWSNGFLGIMSQGDYTPLSMSDLDEIKTQAELDAFIAAEIKKVK